MNLENVKAQMRKGILEYCIFKILESGEAYPSDIISEMKKSKLLVVEGTLYPLLNRLKNDGLLTYRWQESESGPPRKYYSLTDNGRSFAVDLETTWKELYTAVLSISKPKSKTSKS